MTRSTAFRLSGALSLFATLAHADQGAFTNSGGSTQTGAAVIVASSVSAPAGGLSIDCPVTSGQCAGGSLTYLSSDGTTEIDATFTSGTITESCSGGGRGGHITCSFGFTGSISGTLTVNGAVQAITGVTYQAFGTGGAAARGTTAYNSTYAPFYYSDTEQIHRSDDLQGTNQISFGSQGGGVGQFYGAYGIALDAAGRIYVADTYNCRIIRIDDMTGADWTTYGGACGSDAGEFYDPSGIAVDSGGRIYVLDTGNSRVVRMDDMTGANWISFGSVGSGVGHLAPYLSSIAVDSGGRIYVADTGNDRLVRVDDMTGANWTTLTQSPPVNGVSLHSFQSPAAVALDAAGRIYVADDESYAPAVIRVDDMTGANWTSVYVASSSGLNSLSVDAGGTVFTGGGGVHFVDGMAAALASSGSIGPIGSYYVFGVTPIPLPSPAPPAVGLSSSALAFSQNVGTSGPPQTVTLSNFGRGPLNLSGISTTGAFGETNDCPALLQAGSTCRIGVFFAPSATGPGDGTLTIADDSFNLGPSQTVLLSGVGTFPAATVTPTSLLFSGQVVGTTSLAKSVLVRNTGTGPLHVAGVTTSGPFSQTNTCGTLAAGTACIIRVSFTPTAIGFMSGQLRIVDDAGTQTVGLIGAGTAPITLSTGTLHLGLVAVGSTSAVRTVTLTNRANGGFQFSGIVTSAGFAVASDTCSPAIAAKSSCAVGVAFTPAATGAATGTLTFTDGAPGSPQVVTLTGTGY